MGTLEVVVGGQYGSEGKGAITAWRSRVAAELGDQTLGIRVAGPNAGHTVIGTRGASTVDTIAPNLCESIGGEDGGAMRLGGPRTVVNERFAWRLRQVPVAAVQDRNSVVALAAGSEIDLPILLNEIDMLDAAGYDVSGRLYVDQEATLILPRHQYDEKHGRGSWEMVEALEGVPPCDAEVPADRLSGIATKIGSTGKGIGAARADRLWRVPDVRLMDSDMAMPELQGRGIVVHESVADLAHSMLRAPRSTVLIEGTQGFGLGLRAGHYPFCTASDCRAIDFLAMAGISPWLNNWQAGVSPNLNVWVCLRPYPIRVGGNSGPMHAETDWAALGLPEEHTTVTGKVRRVGQWDGTLARSAIRANGGPGGSVRVAMTMMDTIVPEIAGWTHLPSREDGPDVLLDQRQQALKAESVLHEQVDRFAIECQSPIAAVGTGPDSVLSL